MENKKRGFGYLVFLMLIVMIETLIRGYVFMKMYNWFLMEYFKFSEVNLKFSAGLMLIITYLRYKSPEKDTDLTWEMILKGLTAPLFFLLYAYIIQVLIK